MTRNDNHTTINTFSLGSFSVAFAALACTFAAVQPVAAAPIVLTDSAPQTRDGQRFVFTFQPVVPTVGDAGSFTVHARGDYSSDTSSEYLNWSIEGLASGTASPYRGATIVETYAYNDVQWEQTWIIDGSVLQAVTADGIVSISTDVSSAVGPEWSADPFVGVSLTVPEPATMGIVAIGGAIAMVRRRRKRRASL